MKKFFTFIIIAAVSLFPVFHVNAQEYTYGQCIQECNLQGGINCADQCENVPGQTACGLLGCSNLGIDPTRFEDLNVLQIFTLITSLIFVGIIALGIFYVVKAVIKIIRSEGDPSKVEEGSKIFKGIFIGLIMILAGIVGVVLMVALFQAGDIFSANPELPPIP